MKKFITMLSLVLLGFASTSCYDDSKLWDSVNDLDARVETLETLCAQMNSNLSSLTELINAMTMGDVIIGVTPIKENGVEVGYQILLKDGGIVKIYHGKDGADGKDGVDGNDGTNGTNGAPGQDATAPEFGVKQEDGVYYWTLDGEFVHDEEGNKIPTTAAAPKVKVEEETWMVSYDDGKTWTELGPAVTVGIKDVEYTDDVLILTMNDGTKINVNIGTSLKVVLGDFDAETLSYGTDLEIPYAIEGSTGEVVVFLLREGEGFVIDLVEETSLSGKVVIRQNSETKEELSGKVGIFAVAEDGTTVSKAVKFNSGVFYAAEGTQGTYTLESKLGRLEFKVATNRPIQVKTNADWLVHAATKAVQEKTLVFQVAANDGDDERSTTVELNVGEQVISFTVVQPGGFVFEETLVGAYKVTYLWVYGGTGPEYGGASFVDMHNKTNWFDKTTGHGIKAELDNYLEFALTEVAPGYTQSAGTCVNWAGVDGKNWDTWFYDNYNPADGTYYNQEAPKDAADFYRQIPIGESTWVRDYTVYPNTVTFTDKEGRVTVVELFDSEYTFVPGYKDKNAASNTRVFPRNYNNVQCDLTFHKKITSGTKDNWTYAGKEIDKICYRPRDYFIDVDKVEEVPAEAKTTEAKWVPEFPKVATLAGTYKFKDGKTVGGKDGAITAKGLIEQYGGWDPVKASINSMKDDKYTFTVTGTDANGNETGTVTFDKGADGTTWDYKLLDNMSGNAEYDGTDMYCIFSIEGTTTYVYNVETGIVTLNTDGREYVIDVLTPRTYKYSGLDVAVPSASAFGFHLDLGYTEERVAGYASKSTSNGFARHYVWARHHVFMFDKE